MWISSPRSALHMMKSAAVAIREHQPKVKTMRVAFIGAGLQMRRRAPVVVQSPGDELIEVVGTESSPPEGLIEQLGCSWSSDWHHTIGRADVDTIVVCTPPHIHAEITIAALETGKHV